MNSEIRNIIKSALNYHRFILILTIEIAVLILSIIFIMVYCITIHINQPHSQYSLTLKAFSQ